MISEAFQKKMDKSAKKAEYQRKRYAAIRAWALWYLGGKCEYCGTVENLQIHDIIPVLEGRGKRRGWTTLKRWMTLIPEGRMVLTCAECHVREEHAGNTNGLKKKRDE